MIYLLKFFTDPYPNELLYSTLARYHFYSGNIDFRDTLEEIFKRRDIVTSIVGVCNLEGLIEQLNFKYKLEEIVNDYTLYPFYGAFLLSDTQDKLLRDILGDGKGVYARIGLSAGGICKKECFYYCQECVKIDVEIYGEPYFHREHQLQGINYCAHHAIKLMPYKIEKKDRSRIEYIRLDIDELTLEKPNLNIEGNSINIYEDVEVRLAKMALNLLKLPFKSISYESVHRQYKSLLAERDLITSSGRVRQGELYEEFSKFYGEEFLEKLESKIDPDDEYNWLKVLTRNDKRSVHPLRHLLFINFFGSEIQNLLLESEGYLPFGKGPWPCLNPTVNHYKDKVIKDIIVTRGDRSGMPLGTFSCECGFVYTRLGPDKNEIDKYRKSSVKSFGEIWINEVKHLFNQGSSIHSIARKFEVDWKTVHKYIHLKPEDVNDEGELDYLDKYKSILLQVMENESHLSRNDIRNKYSKEYYYLFKYDKEWLMENLPPRRSTKYVNNRVDWEKRDAEYLLSIKKEYKSLLETDYNQRITISVLGKRLGILSILEKKLDKLPLTKAYLEGTIESVQEFQIRKCKKAIQQMIIDNEEITIGKLRKMVKMRDRHYSLIEGEILNYLSELNLE